MAEPIGNALFGALVSDLLTRVIREIETINSCKSEFEALKSTMKRVLPIVLEIESLQQQLELGVNEVEELRETIDRVKILIQDCPKFGWFNILDRSKYAKKIGKVNEETEKFCQIYLQLLQYRSQLQSQRNMEDEFKGLRERMDLLTVTPTAYTEFCSVPPLDFVPVGFDWPLMELKKKVLDDSLNSVLVSAGPGWGKTTLVTQLCHDAKIKGEFTHIFFCVVTSTPNFRDIVQNLYRHNARRATFDNDMQANVALRALMMELRQSGQILLVLDDVWQGAEISFLENFKFYLPGYKILVTSRSSFSTLSSTYQLETLKDEDARKLLIQWASQPHQASQAKYEDLLQKILKHCNGFPIVIKVLGASLKGKDLFAWEAQVESWSGTILDYDDVKGRLQPSFDALKNHLQNCFMDMGSFVEDQKIRASVVIDIWVELYSECRSIRFMSYLNDLASQNLLKVIPLGGNAQEEGFYNEFLVTQHDILRELAIFQSKSKANLERERERLNLEIRGDNIPDWCLDPMHTINARLLSISTLTTDDLFSSNQVEMKCPKVEALILNLSSSTYALPNCIATMEKLKVVVIINHGPNPAKLTNLSCLNSSPNLRRIRLEKVSVTWLDILQLKLQRLRKLSFVMCSFGKVSHDTKEDVFLALPSLQEVDMDYCYDLVELPFWFSEVVSLKTLSITNCNKLTKLPEAIGKLSKLEVLRLKSCINLSELPETTERLRNLQSLDISDCLGLEKLPLEIGNLQKLKKISMRKCGKCELPESVKKLEDLEVKCDEESAFLWEKLKSKMKNLTVTVVETEHNLNLFKLF